MPDLAQNLQGRDLGFLCIVADLWGVDLNAPDVRVGLQRLEPLLLTRQVVDQMLAELPAEARLALDDLLENEGRLPWSLFTRRYGAVREMGAGRRDREKPYLSPVSPAEMLWYRALVGSAFLEGPTGLEEHAYIPDDLIPLLPPPSKKEPASLGRPATTAERAEIFPVSDRLLDHACTLLAALRLGLSPQEIEQAAANWAEPPLSCAPYSLTPSILQAMLKAAGLLDAAGPPLAQPTRSFLEADRGAALVLLAQGWLHSPDFNDLLLMPGLLAEGEWRNDPLRARQSVMDFLSSVPPATWWSLNAFVAAIRQSQPDFQRPAGDYDSWYLRLQPGAEPVKSTGKEHPAEPEPSEDQERLVEYLRGFEHWDEVDGALIRFLIQGPLHWLGFVELAAPGKDKPASAFRLSPWEPGLLAGEAPAGLPVETAKVQVSSDALLRVPGAAPRAVRYQVARFAAWEGEKNGVYTYRLTPGSLQRARLQELTVSQLLSLLRRHAALVPPNLSQALTRWEERGVEARLERVTVLRLSHPSMLRTLSSSPAARFLGDALGPTTVIVRPGAWSKVLAVLAELGYLGEVRVEDETQKKPPE